MLVNTDINLTKILTALLSLSCLCSTAVYAEKIDCSRANSVTLKKICGERFNETREKLNSDYKTALLISDSPIRLLEDTHSVWFKRLQQCKSSSCYEQQFDLRSDDLKFYTSLNQSLTNHYLKFEHGQIASTPVHLQVHQLSKDKIKIEGMAYRNPNNKTDKQSVAFLAYTNTDQKHQIKDNEHDCQYQFNFNKAILSVKTQQKGCERFVGVYRIYD